jgi:hypothetical protein
MSGGGQNGGNSIHARESSHNPSMDRSNINKIEFNDYNKAERSAKKGKRRAKKKTGAGKSSVLSLTCFLLMSSFDNMILYCRLKPFIDIINNF